MQRLSDLFSHWLRVGDGCAEEAVPLQSAIQPSPVVVPVAGVRQTPWDDCVELTMHWIAGFTLSTGTDAAEHTSRRATIALVIVRVTATDHRTDP